MDIVHIPDSLYADANAVVRYEHTLCEIRELTKKLVSKDAAITVLDEGGKSKGIVQIYYTDKSDNIKNLKIEIYNAKGELIKKVKKKQIMDLSVYDGFSVANDARQKYFSYTSNEYPYTVKYSYELESENTLQIPMWVPLESTGVSVQENTYEIRSSIPNASILNKKRNVSSPQIEIIEDKLLFRAKNMKAIKYEPLAPSPREYFPLIRFMPTKFSYFDVEGSFTDWKSYGKWIYENMLKGRETIPESLIKELDEKISEETSKSEIARIVYDHVTQSTRYVSVQLGIGGFKPFSSTDVFDLKYGDCKALSFYVSNILKHYGIEAIYTEIMSDRDYAIDYESDLPGPGQGNHIILCLPNAQDTSWLECTSNAYFYGYAHSGIDNRKALMIDSEGGKLVTTKSYSAKDNLAEKKANISIYSIDSVHIEFENTYYNQRHEPLIRIMKDNETERADDLRSRFFDHLPKYDLLEYEIASDDVKKRVKEKANISTRHLLETAGNYIILPYMVESIHKPETINIVRNQSIYIKSGWSDKIEIKVSIPEGYVLVEEEKDLNYRNSFGSINITKKMLDSSTFQISVDIEYLEGTFDPLKALEYNLFAEHLGKIINDKIIFKTK